MIRNVIRGFGIPVLALKQTFNEMKTKVRQNVHFQTQFTLKQ